MVIASGVKDDWDGGRGMGNYRGGGIVAWGGKDVSFLSA